jgi:NAD(P)H-quinone oxidoreductase subunit 5
LSSTSPLVENNSAVVHSAFPLLFVSGALGVVIGSLVKLDRGWNRPLQKSIRMLQDLLAYDFYLERIYQLTVVAFVSNLAKFTNWFDRYIVDGLVNLVSLATIFSGNALKYNASGQSQFYILTIILGVSLLIWSIVSSQWENIMNYWSSFYQLILALVSP